MEVDTKKWVRGLSDGESRMILRLLVLTHYQRVTDGQDGDTPPIPVALRHRRAWQKFKFICAVYFIK